MLFCRPLLSVLSALCLTGTSLLAQANASATSSAQADASTNATLSARIDELLRDPAVARAHWGVAVTTLQGVPVLMLDVDKLFRPASTAKLFTGAAALTLLGPDHRFTTRVYGELDKATGTVHGDLTLVGGGDPSLGTADLPYKAPLATAEAAPPTLDGLATDLVARGVKQVDGNIVGDDTLFEAPTVPEGWAAEDLLWGYGALPSALAFADNEVRVTVTLPASQGDTPGPPELSSNQPLPFVQFQNDVVLQPATVRASDAIDAEPLASNPQRVRLFGALSAGAPAAHETVAVQHPAAYAAEVLRYTLANRGTQINGEAETLPRPPATASASFLHTMRTPGCETSLWSAGGPCALACAATARPASQLLASQASAPLIEDLTFTLKTSANLHAEVLLHHLGLLAACPGVTTAEGARVLHSWLLHIGIADADVTLYDGSGLSTKDLVTPHAEAQLLAYAATQPWFPQWKLALPIGGVDGTLLSRFTEPSLKGRVFAKTGTLGETRALAGYVHCASGRDLIVSILVDNHQPGNAADRVAMDKVVAAIAELD